MQDREFMELSARCEALARLNLHLLAVLEDTGVVDGPAFRSMLRTCLPSGSRQLLRAAELMEEMTRNSSEALATRRRRKIWRDNQPSPDRSKPE